MAPCAPLRHVCRCGPGHKHGRVGHHGFAPSHGIKLCQMETFDPHHMEHRHRRGHGKMHGLGHFRKGHGHFKKGHGHGHFKPGHGHGHFKKGHDHFHIHGHMEAGPHPMELGSGESHHEHNEHHRGPRGPHREFEGPRHGRHQGLNHGHRGPHGEFEYRPIHAECSDCTSPVEPNAEVQGATEPRGRSRLVSCCRGDRTLAKLLKMLDQYLKDMPCCQEASNKEVQAPTTDTDQSNQAEVQEPTSDTDQSNQEKDAPPNTEATKE